MICNILEYPKSINRGKQSHSFHRDFTEKRITFQKANVFCFKFLQPKPIGISKISLVLFLGKAQPWRELQKNFQKQMCRANRVKPSHGCTRSNNEAVRNTAEKKSLQAAVRDLGSLGSFWTPSNLPERGCWKNIH